MSDDNQLVEKLVLPLEEIRQIKSSGVFWNDTYMRHFCGKVLKMRKIERSFGKRKTAYIYHDYRGKTEWMFADAWVTDPPPPIYLESELFEIW